MSESKHTPLPWRADGDYVSYLRPSGYTKPICRMYSVKRGSPGIEPDMPLDEAEANAALIVHAVNCHNEMLAAIRAARPLLVSMFDCYTAYRDQLRRGEVPVPLPAHSGEDDRATAVIKILTDVLLKHNVAKGGAR